MTPRLHTARRRRLTVLGALLSVAAAGCSSGIEPTTPAVRVAGSYAYRAVTSDITTPLLEGRWDLVDDAMGHVGGTYLLVAACRTATGAVADCHGTIVGQREGATIVLAFDDGAWRHQGIVHPDGTITGLWSLPQPLSLAPDGAPGTWSGTFTARPSWARP